MKVEAVMWSQKKNVLGQKNKNTKLRYLQPFSTWCQPLAEKEPLQGLTQILTPGHSPTPISFFKMRIAQLSLIPI